MSTNKAQRQPLSDSQKKLMIIIAIVLAAVIAVSVTLGVLLKPVERKPDDDNTSNNPSSNLPIKNSNFALVNSEDTAYPKSALNWNKYGYKAPSGNSHDFEVIDTNTKVVMGIVDTAEDKWATVVEDLNGEGVTLDANPGQHKFLGPNEKHDNSNVYLIAAKTPTNALVMSDSVSVSATTSVKITIRVNTSQLKSGNAIIMVQNSSTTPNAKEENRYAYKYDVAKADNWQQFELYVFNRKTSTQYIRVAVGLGNSYTNENAEGQLYVDDIVYETVTANDYRLKADEAEEADTTYKIIEKEEETTVAQQSAYLNFSDLSGNSVDVTYDNSNAYVDSTKTSADTKGYSPFTTKDDFTKDADSKTEGNFGIYKLSNDGSQKAPLALRLSAPVTLQLAEDDDSKQDYAHVSFWIRTTAKNELAFANVTVESRELGGEWDLLSSGDFTVKTEQNIATDTNNGWTKYDVYLKPAQAKQEVRLTFALGSVKGYEGLDWTPKGDVYVTTPYYETISSSAYTNASASTAVKKFDLSGSTATTSITNGSFSNVAPNTQYPSNWTPAFAGQNIIYKDGQPNQIIEGLSTDETAVAGSGVVTSPFSNYADDDANKILKLVSNKTADNKLSSYGMISSDFTASAKSVYVFSVLAKSDNARPYFYLIENNVSRDKAIVGKVEKTYDNAVNGASFCQADSIYKDTGWVRYYIVYVVGDKDASVKLALFNGSIDGSTPAQDGATIYYDKVTVQNIGTYTAEKDTENKDATEYKIKFTAATGYPAFTECEDVAEVLTEIGKISSEIVIDQPTDEEWKAIKAIPEDKDDDKDDGTTEPVERDVDLALLFSILSSVLLIAALGVVVVIKLFKNRKTR